MDPKPGVLVLDDDSNLRKTLGDILRIKGFRPILLASGKEALERISAEDVAVALIDLRLSDMPGLDVLSLLREKSPTTECILMTGNASQASAIDAVNLGAYSYIQKPFEIDQLILTIQRAVEKRTAAKALAESQVRYHTFINATTDMAFLKDEQFRYVIVNAANARFLGKPVEEVVGRDDFELMSKNAAQACRESDEQALQAGTTVIAVEEVAGRFYETRKFPVPLQDGHLGVGGYVRDITEQKIAEASLRASEERYRMLAENMTDTIWLMDLSLKIIYITPSVTRLRGYTLEELNTIPLDRQMTPNSFQTVLKIFADALSPESLAQKDQPITRSVELEFYKKDGTPFWSDNTFTLIREPDGTPKAILGSGRNISEQKNARQALEDSEKRFRALIENSSDIITLIDPRGKVLYHSPAFQDVMGYSPQSRVGQSALELIHPEDQQAVSETINAVIQRAGQSRNITFRSRHKDGSWRWMDATATNLLGESAIQGIVVNIRDITKRRLAEQELRLSEEKFRNVIQQSADGITISDESGTIIEWNRGQEEITGLKRQDTLGKKIWDVQFQLAAPEKNTPEIYEQVKTSIQAAFTSESAPFLGQITENAFFHPQKGRRFMQALVFPLPTEKSRLLCSISRDVTDKKQAEEILRRQLAELEVLYENGLTISRLLEPRQIAQKMIDILSTKLDWHHAAIRLYHPETDSIEALAISHPGLSAGELQQQLERLNQVITRPGKGMSGWVIKNGKPIRSGNVEADRRYISTYPNIHSGLYIPVQLGERILGSIAVESELVNAFSEQDERILSTLASQAAIAFENARLYQEAVRDAEQRAILHRAGQNMAAAGLDLESVYASIQAAAAGLMPFDVFLISLNDLARQEIEVVYALDCGERYTGYRLPVGEGISGRVIKEHSALLIQDYKKTKKAGSTAFGKGDARSILAVPMFSGRTVIGVVSVQAYQPDQFKDRHTTLLEMLAAFAGPAIENARLFENERKQRQLSEALRDALGAGASLSESLDFDQIMDRLLAALEKVIPFDGADIMLVDRPGNLVRVARTRGFGRFGAQTVKKTNKTSLELSTTENLRWMDEKKQALVIPDTSAYPGWVKANDIIRSWAGAPIIVQGEVIAFFSTIKSEADFYNQEHAGILRAFAGQASLALQNARLFEQTNRHIEELSALAQVSSTLRSALTRTEMLPPLIEQVSGLLHAEEACLIAYDPVTGESFVEAGRGKMVKTMGRRVPAGEGIVGWMAQTHLPYQNSDILQDQRLTIRDVFPQPEAVAGVPLLIQEKYLGALWIGRSRKRGQTQPIPFTAEEVRLLGSIADITANALQRASLHEQTVQHAEQLTTVNEIGRVLGETLELDQIYTRLTGSIYNLIPDLCGLFISLYNPKSQTIVCACGHSDGVFVEPNTLPIHPIDPSGMDRQSRVIQSGETLLANDLGQTPQKRPTGKQAGNPARKPQSGLYVPMIVKGAPIGLIKLLSYTPNRFGQEEINLLSLVANTAAIAIENARLFSETQKRLRNLSALHAVDSAIGASVDLRITLGILLEHAAAELKADAAAILQLNPISHMLEYTTSHGFYTHMVEGIRLNLGDGPAGQAAIQRKIQSIPDMRTGPVHGQRGNIHEGEGFITQHAIPLVAKGQVQGVLEIFHRSLFQPDEEWFSFLDMLSGQAAIAIDNSRLFDDLQRSNLDILLAYDATIQGWSQALELRDKETEGHAQRVTDLTVQLARFMGLPGNEMEHIRRGTLLHDIGKMGVPDAILLKPDKLTPEEWEIMKQHPVFAYEMLAPVSYLRPALAIPHYHHEKWDGSGYPDGLKGEQIPLAARIFAIVDVYDALTSDRPYRPAWTKEKTLDHIRTQIGTHFDPKVADAFLHLLAEEK